MSLPRFIVPSAALHGSSCVLTGDTFRHFRARRLRVGSRLVLADGAGTAREGVVAQVDRRQALVNLSPAVTETRESPLHLVLAQGILKGDKLDVVVEKATELGVHEILFFTSERTVGRVASQRQARWTRIACSAAQQSQRTTVPNVRGPVSLEDVLAYPTAGLRLFFWEGTSTRGLLAARERGSDASDVFVVVGPEGGFSADEARRAARAGFDVVGLSRRILRAETAAVVVVTLAQFLWGDLASPSPSRARPFESCSHCAACSVPPPHA